ncbi:glycine-rich domain-containing protein [Serratia proteamaculans]
MATNNIKAFGIGAGSNVISQADYEALPSLITGFQTGKASSAQINKALRQATFIAAAVAQYTADKSGEDVLDDGDVAKFISNMSGAFGKDFQSKHANLTALSALIGAANKLPYFTDAGKMNNTDLTSTGRDLIGKADVTAILTYLGLGDVTGYVGRKIAERWITQSGPYIPSPGAKRIRVTLIGGGAGGGGGQGNSNGYVSAGSGGGAGGVSRKTIDLTSASPFQVTIGVGGRAGVFSSDQPGDGGVSTFGSNMVAYGGGRGSNCGSVAFGVTQLVANGGGGISSGGDINTIGGSGGTAIILGQGYVSGGGGNSVVAGGGQPITTSVSTNGIDGSYGSGGSGAYVLAGGSEKIGGRGGDGVCIIEEYA